MASFRARKVVNVVATAACGAMVVVAVAPLASVLWLVVSRGASGLSFAFFTHLPTPVGEPSAHAIPATGTKLNAGAGGGEGSLPHAARASASAAASAAGHGRKSLMGPGPIFPEVAARRNGARSAAPGLERV